MKKFLTTLFVGSMIGLTNLVAADAPVIPSEKLTADYAIFDYVFAGVIGVAFVFMVARRVKGFIR